MRLSESEITWEKERGTVEVKYHVEYVDNKKDWDYICSGKTSLGEPWERYKEKVFTDFADACLLYMVMSIRRSQIFDVRIFAEISYKGEPIAEYTVPNGLVNIYELADEATRGTARRNVCFDNERKKYVQQIAGYEAFLKEYNAGQMFKEFKERETA